MRTHGQWFRLSAVLCLGSFVLDFRGAEGGSWIQQVFAALALLSGAMLAAQIPWRAVSGRTRAVFALWNGYVVYCIAVGVVRGVPLGHVARVAIPYVLLSIGFLLALAVTARREQDWEWLAGAAKAFCTVALLWSAFYAVVVEGWDLVTVRYRILSPAVPFAFAIGVSAILAGHKRRLLPWLIFGTVTAVSMISQTRGLVFMYVAAPAVLLAYRIGSDAPGRIATARKLVPLLLVFGLAIAGSFAANRSIFDDWVRRFTVSRSTDHNLDPTYLTRLAEDVGLLREMSNQPVSFITGLGFGHPHVWDGAYSGMLVNLVERDVFYIPTWAPGHNTWSYFYFVGGVVGSVALIALVWMTLVELKLLARWMRAVRRVEIPELVIVGPLALICFVTQSATGNALGTRLGAILTGFSLGLVFVSRHWLRTRALVRRVPRGRYGPGVPLHVR